MITPVTPDYSTWTEEEIVAWEEARSRSSQFSKLDTPWLLKAVENAALAVATQNILRDPDAFKIYGFTVRQMLTITLEARKNNGIDPTMSLQEIKKRMAKP